MLANGSLLATIQDVRAAYRLFLGREADPGGLDLYSRALASGMSTAALRGYFMVSEEYRNNAAVIKTEIGDGLFVFVDPADTDFGVTIVRHRTWEPHIVGRIVTALKPDDTYVDIGANVGVMAFNATRRVGPSGKVIAFEPDRENAARFIEGVAANGFTNIILHQFALSDRRSIVSMDGRSNAYVTAARTGRFAQAILGDDLLQNEPRIDFIKMDIEGFEPFALRGLSNTMRKHQPKVLCEFNPRCLKLHGLSPGELAEEIFALTRTVVAIEHDDRSNTVVTSRDLLALWQARNEEAATAGRLPDGMLHFDLLFDVAR